MKHTTWSFYRLEDGRFTGTTFSAMREEDMLLNLPPGCAAIEGTYYPDSYRIDLETNRLVSEPQRSRVAVNEDKQEEAEQVRQAIVQSEHESLRALRELVLEALGTSPANALPRVQATDADIAKLRLRLAALDRRR